MIRRLLHWPAMHPWPALGLAAALALLAAWGGGHLRFDSSLKNLFSPSDPAAQAMSRVLDDFPSAQEMLVLATASDTYTQPEKLRAFAKNFEREIHADATAESLVARIIWHAGSRERQFVADVMTRNGVLYLSDEEFAAAKERLTRPAMDQQLRQDEALLAAPGPAAGALAKATLLDPLRMHEFIVRHWASLNSFEGLGADGEFFSPDGRSLLIRIAGKKSPSDPEFCQAITAAVQQAAQRANHDSLRLEFSGVYPIAARSQTAIRHDAISSVLGSVACLAILFALAFRRGWLLFAATFAPVAVGILYGLGAFSVYQSAVSPLTAVIGAVLAGIGIDYAVFYVVHELERPQGQYTIDVIGGALLAAWATSVIGFIAVIFASVRILRDFSLVGSLGLAGALLGAVWILPALLKLMQARQRAAVRISVRPLLSGIDRRRGICLIAWPAAVIAGLAFLAAAGFRLPLDNDTAALHPQPNAALQAEADIAQRMGKSPEAFIVLLRADSPEKLVHTAYQVQERLSAARDAGVEATFGLANLLPDPQTVAAREAQVGLAYADCVIAEFDAAVDQSSFDPKALAAYRDFLRTLLSPSRAPGVEDLKSSGLLAEGILPRDSVAAYEAITLVFIRGAANEKTVHVLNKLLDGIPDATLTGLSVLGMQTAATIHRDLPRLILAAVLLIAVYLLIHFRSGSAALLAVLPTLLSLICLLVVAKITGAKMNLVNIVSIPLLIGIDTDYGIFLVSIARQCRGRGRAEFLRRVAGSSQAVVLCALSTILGFGSLAFTSVPAVRSLGWAVGIGVTVCALATLFFLLPLLSWIAERQDEHTSLEH